MATKTPKKPPKPADLSPDLSVDYSSVVRAIHAAKAAFVHRFTFPDGSKPVSLGGRRYIKYAPQAASTHAKIIRAMDKAAELLVELSIKAKVKEV